MADSFDAGSLCHKFQTWRVHFRAISPHCSYFLAEIPLEICLLNEFSLFKRTDLPCHSLPIRTRLICAEKATLTDQASSIQALTPCSVDDVSLELTVQPFEIEAANRASTNIRFSYQGSAQLQRDGTEGIVVCVRFSIDAEKVPRRVLSLDWRLLLLPQPNDDGEIKAASLDLTNGTGRLPDALLRRRAIDIPDIGCFSVVECEDEDIAGKVWDGGLSLIRYIHAELGEVALRGVRVLELGSGTGLVGISCAMHGALVTLTDMIGSTKLLEYNIKINTADIEKAGGSCKIAEHNWGTDVSHLREDLFDILVMSDVVYEPVAYIPLLTSLLALLKPGKRNRAIMGHRSRHPDEMQFFEAAKKQLHVRQIDIDYERLEFPCTDVAVFEMWRE